MENVASRIRFSVIIPTYKREKILKRALDLLWQQLDPKKDEVIVVIGKYGPAKARNEAITKSHGKYLMFLNDDSFVESGFVSRHLEFHQKHKETNKSLVGLTENHPDTIKIPVMQWLVGQSGLHFNYRFKNQDKINRIPWYYLWTCNFSIKREFLIKNKLEFCEEFPTAAWEDIEFAFRAKKAGLKIYFDNQAKAWHFHELNLSDIKSRFVSHGRGLYHLRNKLPDNFLPYLIKSKTGKLILQVMRTKMASAVRNILENIVARTDVYPNIVMQWLVVKWKSDGYFAETKKMSGM